jgi:hypothetical protein
MSLISRREAVAAGVALAAGAFAPGASLGETLMPARTSNLFLLDDLDDAGRMRDLAESDRGALRAVADWTRSFVVRPHPELGRAGPVCPFTPVALDHDALWLAAGRSAGASPPDLVALIEGYKRRLLAAEPVAGSYAGYKSIMIVFADLPAARAGDFFNAPLQQVAIRSYVDDGLVMGAFYEGSEGTAIYNPGFRPFRSPVPLLLMRRAVVGDWKFFLNNEEWLGLWARRYGESGTMALAEALRGLPWNARRS